MCIPNIHTQMCMNRCFDFKQEVQSGNGNHTGFRWTSEDTFLPVSKEILQYIDHYLKTKFLESNDV